MPITKEAVLSLVRRAEHKLAATADECRLFGHKLSEFETAAQVEILLWQLELWTKKAQLDQQRALELFEKNKQLHTRVDQLTRELAQARSQLAGALPRADRQSSE